MTTTKAHNTRHLQLLFSSGNLIVPLRQLNLIMGPDSSGKSITPLHGFAARYEAWLCPVGYLLEHLGCAPGSGFALVRSGVG
jgi:hypothetical protein